MHLFPINLGTFERTTAYKTCSEDEFFKSVDEHDPFNHIETSSDNETFTSKICIFLVWPLGSPVWEEIKFPVMLISDE